MVNNVSPIVTIDWKPDKNSPISLYKQIYNYISMKIFNGDWVIGQKLPSQRKLSQAFGVNRSTIVEALEELASFGIVEGNFGNGTTIINNTWSLIMSGAPPNWKNYIDSGIFKANFPTLQIINRLEFAEGITRLSTGEMNPDLFPQDMMKQVLDNIFKKPLHLNYLEPLGLLELREALCKYLQKSGIVVQPSNILIVSGALQALQLISLCTLQPGSNVYVEIPSFLKSLHVFQSAGMNLKGIPMDESGIIPWIIQNNNANKDTSLLYTTPTFHNPTGLVMTKARRIELMDYCRTNRLPILEDDVFRELWLEEPPPLPLKSYDTNNIVLYLSSVSKSLAPGFRLGWLIGPESVVQRLGDVKMQTDYGTSTLSQWIFTEWLESGLYEEHLKVLRGKLKERRDLALDALEKYFKGIASWEKPKGGYFVWLKLEQNISTEKLFDLALSEKLLINPGSIYDFTKNQYIRLSYAYAPPDELVKGLKRLSEIIRDML